MVLLRNLIPGDSMKKRKTKKSLVPLYLTIGGGLLLIVTAILLATQNAPAAPTPASASHEEETYPEIPRASLEEAKAALDADNAVIVDVRSAEAYAGGHIAGALNIPLAELESRLGELDKAQWIITYCT
ncbi:MAG: rhodanese-like domain-containing protein [Chloroflexi bacterium]|nr:rhodanese-like domain-containing protein [Chloroflexota bacterium]